MDCIVDGGIMYVYEKIYLHNILDNNIRYWWFR